MFNLLRSKNIFFNVTKRGNASTVKATRVWTFRLQMIGRCVAVGFAISNRDKRFHHKPYSSNEPFLPN